jgi:hypothetical protein
MNRVEVTMADASGALGGRRIAGTWVNRRGTAKKRVSKVGASELGGVIGSVGADRVTARSSPVLVETPEFGRDALGGGKLACPLTITFSDGARWEFDVARGGKSAADRVVASLGG